MNSLNSTALDAANLLRELGVYEVTKGVWAFSDSDTANHSYIHHSRLPVALAAYAAVNPTFGAGRFPGYTLIDLVDKVPCMDGAEYAALAIICGAPPPVYPSSTQRADIFGTAAWEVVADYGLEQCFMEVTPFGSPGSHYAMRPRGYDCASEPIPADLKAMRKAYRGMTPLQQVMTLTLMHLYSQGPDRYYLTGGCPTKMPAAAALTILREDGIALAKWGRLVTHYAGW
ncbi:hypothetical protein GIW05_00475 [Pseudomonas syringae]|uniref:hypothetical protein n=1 Tax=Pseudomonas syringae TaxID=317 RepID=UPI001F435E8D|nr:hypothetical protein [Pseudomonas syringae]MCF5381997.1 hypothetical protein [Pseudomonas syringae]MCF5419470.1 hypothetical protein [Pseudomonas syringae]MCF5452016.1 hypothetical protein [Pseudomonas syringae]MCF5456303.1 hypothetical protein [Pseudomonas syringae]